MTGLQHKDDYLETPQWIIKDIENSTGLKFHLDICASYNNKKFDNYITDDGYEGVLNDEIPENQPHYYDCVGFCNPPRSKNGKIVTKLIQEWKEYNIDIVILLCWNDLGNKYCDYLRSLILAGNDKIQVVNLGKVIFDKDGKPTKFPSRLAYFWVWLKSA